MITMLLAVVFVMERGKPQLLFTFNPHWFSPVAPVSWYLQPNVVTQAGTPA